MMAAMNLVRTALEPIARLAAAEGARDLRRFLAAHHDSRRTQDDLLARLLAEHAETGFGKDHGFSGIRSYDDFRKAVPIRDYEDLGSYFQSVWEGRYDALIPPGRRMKMFALTSGTTGAPKRIPITEDVLAHYRRCMTMYGVQLLNDHPAGWLRHILQVTSPAEEMISPAGLPCGAISGMLAKTQKRIVRKMYPVPYAVAGIADADAKYYTIMRLAIPDDVGLITTANPSTILRLFDVAETHLDRLLADIADGTLTPPGDIPAEVRRQLRLRKNPRLARQIASAVERDGLLRADQFWNLVMLMHWTGGTLSLYLPQIRRRCPGVPIRDVGLLASEGRFTVPLTDETPAGVAEITGNVLEFIPAGQIDSARPDVLRPHELTVGEDYFLIVTNPCGLWRYNINDCVRMTDTLGDSPVLAFLSKGDHTANLTGEKLTEHQLVQAVRRAGQQLSIEIPRFVAQPVFANQPYYRIRVELAQPAPDALAKRIDAALAALNVEYASKRTSGRLGPIEICGQPPAVFDARERELIALRKGRREQYKHQYLLTEIDTAGQPAS